jgi:hypothetical protein
MSLISSFGRPIVDFDVENVDHRRWFAEFLATGSWRHSPVRFNINEEGEMIPVIQRKIVAYYSAREFGEIAA